MTFHTDWNIFLACFDRSDFLFCSEYIRISKFWAEPLKCFRIRCISIHISRSHYTFSRTQRTDETTQSEQELHKNRMKRVIMTL